MYQSCVNYSSTMTHQYVPTSSTIHLMYVPTHQLLVSTMYSTCTSTKPHQFYHPNLICSSVIDLVYMITFLQTFLKFNNKRLAFSSNFSLVSFMQLRQISLLGTFQKKSYRKNGIPCWIMAYSREWTCRACPARNIFCMVLKILHRILQFVL